MTQQLEFFAISNPCRDVCEMDSRGFCRGCLRSRAERVGWNAMDEAEKRNVLRLCSQRMQRQQRLIKTIDEVPPEQPALF